ncbi:MAG TPA: CBS domain-containing protein [Candidatus Binataceae bacterium]|nr:CBS domain-containing protein [Candidatus Binataceae bacterium]
MEKLQVRDLMTPDVTTLKRDDRLTIADDIMQLGRIRHLPVTDDDDESELVGIINQRDLFRGALAQALGYGEHGRRMILDTLLVNDVMATEVITTSPDTLLVNAARTFPRRR